MGGREVRKFSPEADYGYVFDHHYVEFSYADGTKLFSQCRHLRGGADKNAVHVHGTQGEVEFRINNQIYGEKQWRRRGEYRNPYEQEHADLVDAILNDKKHNQAWQAATSSMTAVMGRMATYSGKMVHWDEAVAKGPSMMPERLAFDADPPVLPDENGSYEHAVAVPGVTKPY